MLNLNDDSSSSSGSTSGPDFNYILNMSLWCLTKEKVEDIIKQRDSKVGTFHDFELEIAFRTAIDKTFLFHKHHSKMLYLVASMSIRCDVTLGDKLSQVTQSA